MLVGGSISLVNQSIGWSVFLKNAVQNHSFGFGKASEASHWPNRPCFISFSSCLLTTPSLSFSLALITLYEDYFSQEGKSWNFIHQPRRWLKGKMGGRRRKKRRRKKRRRERRREWRQGASSIARSFNGGFLSHFPFHACGFMYSVNLQWSQCYRSY